MDKDQAYWSQRQQKKGLLTLFTLSGDNWPDSLFRKPRIRNLLIRELNFDCFTAELQLGDFVPIAEWQQAGIMLLKDTTLNSPSMRFSLGYNDYFGGYHRSHEIITQAIYSMGFNAKPEEFAHTQLLTVDSVAKIPFLFENLKYSSLKIEKHGYLYRFLYAGGVNPNTAFKEVAVKKIDFTPHYIALFAFKGNATKAPVIPVKLLKFTLQKSTCE